MSDAPLNTPTGPGEQPPAQFPVVAVGASAGGLEAFTDLLTHLPADTGMAFVFIQHLAPDHESMLSQILARATVMPVNQVEDGTVLSPNQVYVIPPNAAMTVSGLTLALGPRDAGATGIDSFLRSLAVSQESTAVAVILSGTGSDGALGVQAIAEEGGIVFVQEPGSAKFDGMPLSAITTGYVDFVLPPAEIASELVRLAREPRVLQHGSAEHPQPSHGAEKEYQALLDLLHAGTGIDFRLYRQATVRRRALRRAGLLRLSGLGEYVRRVSENPDEANALAQDILIRVTRFFRNPEVFDVLSRRVFPALIRRAPLNRPVRIWVPGCSTGEEAYSIAMCFLETAEQMQSRVPAQVFATDINEASIEQARRGAYVENIAGDVSPGRLARFFVRAGREFQVSRKLRDLCVFSRHDLLNDPPFPRVDLVSCRNLLIYLEAMQESALSRFHFALNPGGFLLLGKSEAATSSPGYFAPFDRESRLYVRQEASRQPLHGHGNRGKSEALRAGHAPVPPGLRAQGRIDTRRYAERVVIERYGPARMIVDGDLASVVNGVDWLGPVPPAPGAPAGRILDRLQKGHGEALKKAVRTAGKTGKSVRLENVEVGEGASSREMDIEVTPLGPDRRHYLIVFEDRGGQAGTKAADGEPAAGEEGRRLERRIGRLEKELASSRAHLESVIVEHEAANEEVVASNEELQSLNEELESSKEELEATNEELTTVNQELQVRNVELEVAREFAQATIDTVRSSLLVLGPDLRVLRANRSFYRTFGASPGEVEHRFVYEMGNGRFSRVRQLLENALPASEVLEGFEMEYDALSGERRIVLLNARRFEGDQRILLAMEDVTDARRTAEALRQSQKMEAIGYLAAGIAHDFNNLLTGMIGNASLLLEELPENDPGRRALGDVIGAGERAADLTRQLLAYAGKGRTRLERLDLSDTVLRTSRLVHPSIPAGVQLRLDLEKGLPLLLADPSHMQQVATNLIVNAAEATEKTGGTVLVRTGRQTVTSEPLPDLYVDDRVAPGEYVFLEVVDNGSGMDEQTKSRIFDPFFTTKFTGRGLGLAAVLGIVRMHNGAIQVRSVPGRGSSFRVLFAASEKTANQLAEETAREDLAGTGTILVVDDEEMIRKFTRAVLERYGYTVLPAAGGEEGLRLLEDRSSDIGLVLLDVVMPGMDGLETFDRIRGLRPDLPVLVCTGFGDSDIEKRFAGRDPAGLLRKPYTPQQLARAVKEHMPRAGARESTA